MAIESLGVQIAATMAPTPTALPVLAANDNAARQFAEIMSASQSAATNPAAMAIDGVDPTKASTPGEAILSGLQQVSSEFQTSFQAVRSALDGNVGLQNMLLLQLELVQHTVRQDLVAKVITRSAQNVEQSVKQP